MKLTEIENPRTGDKVLQIVISSEDILNLELTESDLAILKLMQLSKKISSRLKMAVLIARKIEKHNRLHETFKK